MNATEDGMEPVGEAPPINPLSIEPAAWMNAFAAIAEIRALHGRAHGVKLSRADIPDDQAEWACGQCMKDGGPHDPADWVEIPCPTIQILDKWGV